MKDGIRLVCYGSATPASSLVPKAIAMVDRLREVDEFGYQQWQVSDTQRIDVKLNGTHATIWIWEDESESAEACPLYVSGMTWDGVKLKRNDPDTGSEVRATRWFQPAAAYQKRAALSGGWQLIDAMKAGLNPLAPAPILTPENGPASWRQDGWAQISTLHACSYSGTMRQVVAVLLGMESIIPYRYDFTCTHGIWTHTEDGKRKDWLIEISAARGVLAMPVPSCMSTLPPDSVLGYVPTGKPFPEGDALAEAILAGDVRQLLGADALTEFYSKGALFAACGWAYSASGRRACNIVSSPDTLVLNGIACRLPRMSLYVIEIAPDKEGRPASAAINMVESGIAICGSGIGAQKGQIRYPSGNVTSVSLITPLPYDGLIDYANTEAPLYCWYDGEDIQVVRIKTAPKQTARPPDEDPKPRYPGNAEYPAPDGPMLSDIYWIVSGPENLGRRFIEYPARAYASVRPNRSISSPIHGIAEDIEYAGERRTYYAEATAFSIIDTGSQYFPYINTYRPTAIARITSAYSMGATKYHYDCVIVPPAEREAVAHYRYAREVEAGPISSRIDSFAVVRRAGLYQAPQSTDWEATPLVINYELKQEGGGPPPYQYAQIYSIGDLGAIFRSSTGAYGGSYGDTAIPPVFTFTNGVTNTESTQEVIAMFQNLLPLSGTESSPLPKTTASAKAAFVGTGGVYVPLRLDPTDQSAASIDNKWTRVNPEPDGTLHAFFCRRSADGRLYHISPNIDEKGWECSRFGAYQPPPDTTKNSTINFVGDI